MQNKGFLLLTLICMLFLYGCVPVPELKPTDVVVDGQTLPEVALRLEKTSYYLKLEPVVSQLGGSVEKVGEFELLILLNGKRILVGSGNASTSNDLTVPGSLGGSPGSYRLSMDRFRKVFEAAYPSGKVYVKDAKVHVESGQK